MNAVERGRFDLTILGLRLTWFVVRSATQVVKTALLAVCLLFGAGILPCARASDPLETGARGTFEIIPRLDPVRPLPGEDLFLKLTIRSVKPFQTGPHAPSIVELASDPHAGFAGKFRIKALERDNPERIPENAVGAPGTVWTFEYQLTPLRQIDGTYPGEVPEFGLVTTRSDIPWPRLARQLHWLGPFPLRYTDMGDTTMNRELLSRSILPWWLGIAFAAGGILAIAVWEAALWRRSVRHGLETIAKNQGQPRALRTLLQLWLMSRSVVLPAEPIPAEIQAEILRAGYSISLAQAAAGVWAELSRIQFGRGEVDAVALRALERRAGALIDDWSWVPWKRRLGSAFDGRFKPG